MSNAVATGRPITGRFVLICLIAFFGMIIAVNVIMMRFALETLPGKVFSFKGGCAKVLAMLRAFAKCTKPFAASSL